MTEAAKKKNTKYVNAFQFSNKIFSHSTQRAHLAITGETGLCFVFP